MTSNQPFQAPCFRRSPVKDMIGRGNILLGKTGEEIAEVFLKRKRFRILERNLRTPFGEIDLVALDKNVIVFIEVKTRISKDFGPPHLSITKSKKRHIIKNATFYLKKNRSLDRDARIDVISINLTETGVFEKLEYIRSAIWVE